MAAGDGNELDSTLPGDFLDQADIPAEVKCGHLDHCPHAGLVRFAHGCHRLLQQALTVDKFRIRVAQAGGVGAHMLVTQSKAQVSRIHGPQHGIHSWHDTLSSYGFDSPPYLLGSATKSGIRRVVRVWYSVYGGY